MVNRERRRVVRIPGLQHVQRERGIGVIAEGICEADRPVAAHVESGELSPTEFNREWRGNAGDLVVAKIQVRSGNGLITEIRLPRSIVAEGSGLDGLAVGKSERVVAQTGGGPLRGVDAISRGLVRSHSIVEQVNCLTPRSHRDLHRARGFLAVDV